MTMIAHISAAIIRELVKSEEQRRASESSTSCDIIWQRRALGRGGEVGAPIEHPDRRAALVDLTFETHIALHEYDHPLALDHAFNVQATATTKNIGLSRVDDQTTSKAQEQGGPGVGDCWLVVVASERSISRNR
jgi:hypothetical protein